MIPSPITTLVNSVLIRLGVVCISPVPVIVSEEMWHPENALYPIEVTCSGILIVVNDVHPENALFPIEVTLEGMSIVVNEVHPSNAL